jgi:putative MATE family efflux protein
VAAPGAQAKFVEGNLFRHLSVMALSSSVGLVAVFVVDLINMVYVSWLQDPVLTAALGYAGAVMFFTTSFGIGLSIGVSALVSQAVGQRDPALARERVTEGLVLSLALGTLFAVLVFVLLPAIISLLGASGRTAEETLLFLRLYTASQPLLIVAIVGAAVLRSYGEARRAMMVTVWGAVVLAALDPVLILWADWGLAGAALAGAASRLAMAVMALWPVWRRIGGFARTSPEGLRFGLAPLLAIAFPAILTQIATPVGQALVTRMVAGFGEAAVTGMAIAGRLTPVAFAMIFAMTGAIGPIIGQNLGAGRMDRVRRVFIDGLIFTALVILAVSALLFVLRGPIADLFHAEGLTRDIVFLFCGPLALLWFFNGAIFVGNAVCNNLGRPFWSTVVNWGRHTLGTIPLALWLGQYWGAQGVLIGQALGGVLFGLAAAWLALLAIRAPVAPRPRGSQVPEAPSEAEPVASPGEGRA